MKTMPTIDTVEGVWPNANWNEREVYDMFGITFNNHSDLRRILMPDDWVGHPLRKDFPLGGEEIEFTYNVREPIERERFLWQPSSENCQHPARKSR